MKPEVRFDKYWFSHRKNPRGYGSWWFGDKTEVWTFNAFGSYTEAKNAAIKAAKSNGISTIYVLP